MDRVSSLPLDDGPFGVPKFVLLVVVEEESKSPLAVDVVFIEDDETSAALRSLTG